MSKIENLHFSEVKLWYFFQEYTLTYENAHILL